MDGSDVVDRIREDAAVELDRLGSEKALVAATGADLGRETVLATAAAAEARARDTFAAWADDEASADARAAFAEVAATEDAHHDRVVALLDGQPDPPDPDALHGHLRGLEGIHERVGAGLVGRSLAASRSLLQFVSFFVNEAARSEADLFRDLRADTDETVERGASVLDAVCASDDEFERARDAAVEAIEVAYREYADQLEAMGVDPKPVC